MRIDQEIRRMTFTFFHKITNCETKGRECLVRVFLLAFNLVF